MESNELRIGNYVDCYKKRHNEKFIEVESIELYSINYDFCGYYVCDLIPIPITEDWLLKFGFEKDSDLVNSLCKSGIWFNVKNMEATYLSHKLRKINYVHELQNLYFALTGEELTIK
jgi:hypothetical protein